MRCLREHFDWTNVERIEMYNDFVPYSFYFQVIRNGDIAFTVGLILHRQDNLEKAYYSVHT